MVIALDGIRIGLSQFVFAPTNAFQHFLTQIVESLLRLVGILHRLTVALQLFLQRLSDHLRKMWIIRVGNVRHSTWNIKKMQLASSMNRSRHDGHDLVFHPVQSVIFLVFE